MTTIATQTAPVPVLIPNRFGGKCGSCQTWVAIKTGFAWKSSKGWRTLCSSTACVHTATGWDPTAAAGRSAKLGMVDGEEVVIVVTPFEKTLLPLLQAMPGARWRPELKLWTASAAAVNRERLLELLDRGQIDVEQTLRHLELDEATTAALARAEAAGAFPFQLDGIRHLASRSRAILADDMGLGKTFQTLMSVPERGRVLAVVPNSIKRNWATEIAKWRPDLTAVVIKKKADVRFPTDGEVVIVNFEALRGLEVDEGLITPLMAKTVLVVDEAHRCKNYKAQQTKAISQLAKLAKHTWLLTGTPLLGRPFDLYGVLSAGGMSREVFGGFHGFLRDFNGYKNRYGGFDFGTPRESVPEKMRRVMLRRLKSDVLDLPAKTYQTLVVDLEDKTLIQDLDTLYTKIGGDEALVLPPFELFSSLRKRLAAERIKAAEEFVADCEEQDVPLLVFSAHVKPVQEIGARPGWAAVYGDTPADERQTIVDAFQAGKLKGVAMTIQAGGVGLTLTRASTVLFVDLDWTPGNNIQAEDRVHRIGQTATSIQIVRMVSDHPLDLHVLNLLSIKEELVKKAIENVAKFQETKRAFTAETQEELAMRMAAIQAEQEALDEEAKRQVARGKLTQKAQNLAKQGVLPKVTLTDALRVEICACVQALASSCDGARTKDNVGFNKADTSVGHWYALAGFQTDDDYRVALHMVQKYVGQVGDQFPLVFG